MSYIPSMGSQMYVAAEKTYIPDVFPKLTDGHQHFQETYRSAKAEIKDLGEYTFNNSGSGKNI